MNDVFIIDGIRTPIGSFRGSLSSVRTDDLAAMPLKYIRDKYEFLTDRVDDVLMGCANQAGEDNRNVARMSLLLAGFHHRVPGETVNRLCASGMSAVVHGRRAILSGDADIIISGGVEHMTRAPFVISKSGQPYGTDNQMFDTSFGWRFVNSKLKEMYGTDAMGETAENLADKYLITREEQDVFAFHSQMKASKAQDSGRFEREIMHITLQLNKNESRVFSKDEFVKPNTSLEILAKLKSAFRSHGSVTAGNASGLNDGAAALLLASDSATRHYSLIPLCRIVSSAVTGVEPRIMGIGPVEASKLALKRAGLTMEQMDIIEINEAFAVQVLSCLKELSLDFNDPRVNPNGGGIALGHPLGMSGARILLTAAHELKLTQKKYALVTMCIGVGQGYAVIIENV
jgi:acetyl-CoA acyltransferase